MQALDEVPSLASIQLHRLKGKRRGRWATGSGRKCRARRERDPREGVRIASNRIGPDDPPHVNRNPPSTASDAPVMKAACFEQRKRMAAATSSGAPTRFKGAAAAMSA